MCNVHCSDLYSLSAYVEWQSKKEKKQIKHIYIKRNRKKKVDFGIFFFFFCVRSSSWLAVAARLHVFYFKCAFTVVFLKI